MDLKRTTNRMTFCLLLALLLFGFNQVYAQTATPPAAGDGSVGNPYEISTLENLYWLSQNSGKWDKHYIQTADIDASPTSGWDGGAGFSPIGNGSTKFTGSYDGDGYTISGLTINRPGAGYQALFGYTIGATIRSLGVTNCSISGEGATGGLVGYSSGGSVSNCYTTGSVSGGMNVAGLVAGILSDTTVSNCYSTCSVSTSVGRVGGLVGYCNGPVSNSYSTGTVTGTGGAGSAGGLIGLHYSTVSNGYSRGSVTIATGSKAGGLIGNNNGGSVSNCYSTGSVTGASDVGGLLGVDYGTVTASFWDTQTSGQSSSPGGTGKTTAEMKMQATFTDAGWDFECETTNGTDDYWGISGTYNDGYPFLTWDYTGGAPEIDVQRPVGTSIADGGTDNVGNQAVGTVNLAYTIDNTAGAAQLDVTGVTASNLTNCSNFSVGTALPLNVAAGGTATLAVSFDVDATGPFSLDMDIANNDCDEDPYDIAIQGTGVEEPTAIDLVSFSAEAGAGGVALAWETATEVDNAGFNLHRALTQDGPWTQINDGLIAAQGDPVSGASYSFVDAPGYGTFYYELEDVDYHGMSTLHSPMRVTVARPLRRPLYRPRLPEF